MTNYLDTKCPRCNKARDEYAEMEDEQGIRIWTMWCNECNFTTTFRLRGGNRIDKEILFQIDTEKEIRVLWSPRLSETKYLTYVSWNIDKQETTISSAKHRMVILPRLLPFDITIEEVIRIMMAETGK